MNIVYNGIRLIYLVFIFWKTFAENTQTGLLQFLTKFYFKLKHIVRTLIFIL